ncbi:MAG: hypothetical protein ACI9DF_002930 [Verrucomicrobiales bacterium]
MGKIPPTLGSRRVRIERCANPAPKCGNSIGRCIDRLQFYCVEYSTDLQTWTLISVITGTDAQTSFTDADADRVAGASGYYRVILK